MLAVSATMGGRLLPAATVFISNYRPAGHQKRGVTSKSRTALGGRNPANSADDASYPAYADDSNDSAR